MERRTLLKAVATTALATPFIARSARAAGKEIVYITPGLDLPFWRYLSRGIEASATKAGFTFAALDSHNNAQTQLSNAQDAISRGVAGICISPTDSSTAPSVLALASAAQVPAVIADIGTNSGDYVSFVISDNDEGAYGVGQALAAALKAKGWSDGTVGIVAHLAGAQERSGAHARVPQGDGRGWHHQGGRVAADGQPTRPTRRSSSRRIMLTGNPGMRGLWMQTDQPTLGALRAIKAARRTDDVLVAAFDGTPEFVDLHQGGPSRRLRHAAALFDGADSGRTP